MDVGANLFRSRALLRDGLIVVLSNPRRKSTAPSIRYTLLRDAAIRAGLFRVETIERDLLRGLATINQKCSRA